MSTRWLSPYDKTDCFRLIILFSMQLHMSARLSSSYVVDSHSKLCGQENWVYNIPYIIYGIFPIELFC